MLDQMVRSTMKISTDALLTAMNFVIESDGILDPCNDEISNLLEVIRKASKGLRIACDRRIFELSGENFEHDERIRKLIEKVERYEAEALKKIGSRPSIVK